MPPYGPPGRNPFAPPPRRRRLPGWIAGALLPAVIGGVVALGGASLTGNLGGDSTVVAGDPSPLHALRAEPMLDPVSGALLVLGLVLAAVRWRESRTSGLVVWLVGALAVTLVVGGPAQPNTLVAIHALPPVLLLAAGALIAAALPNPRLRGEALDAPYMRQRAAVVQQRVAQMGFGDGRLCR